jgi:hypothetical protein
MYYTTVGGDQSRFSGHFLSASGPIHNIVANTCTHVLSKNSFVKKIKVTFCAEQELY